MRSGRRRTGTTGCDIPTAARAARAFVRKCVAHSRSGRWGRRTRSSGGEASARRFYNEYLGRIKLNDVFVDFGKKDLRYLTKERYDAYWTAEVNKAVTVASLKDVPANAPRAYKILYKWACGRWFTQ